MTIQLTILGLSLALAVACTIQHIVTGGSPRQIPLWIPLLFLEIAVAAQFIPAH